MTYSAAVKAKMIRFYRSLNERDRRWYAAVEAEKLGHGGIEYTSKLLNCDQKTIRCGIRELEPEKKLNTERLRKKGADVSG
jgi:hypothetical protein